MIKKGIKFMATAVLASVVLVACGQDNEQSSSDTKGSSDETLKVTTTVFPLQSFVEQIGGDHVEVNSIYPTGADLHSYEPSQKDIMDASKSDLFVYTGDDLDPVAKKVAGAIKEDDHKLSLEDQVDQSSLLADEHDHEHEGEDHEEAHEHSHGAYDPHVWLDPKLDETFVKEIRDQLSEKDPEHKEEYQKNADNVLKDLKGLDQDMKKATEGHEGHAVFISHESLGYLANRYGFVQKGVQGLNSEDPSQKELTNIIKEINDTGAKYILYEENVSNKMTDTIRKETEAEPLKFNNMEAVTKDQSKDETFQTLMKENIKNINKALDEKIEAEDEHDEHDHAHEERQ